MTENFLTRILGCASFDKFLNDHWETRPFHQKALLELGAELLDITSLEMALETGQVTWPQVRVVQNGQGVSKDQYFRTKKSQFGPTVSQLDGGSLEGILGDGSTLIIDKIDHLNNSVRRVCSSLEKTFKCSCFANAYLTTGTKSQGFRQHWDDHEVFVFQIYGKKNWKLYPPTRSNPLAMDVEDALPPDGSQPPLEILIAQNDFLYVPHGWWHEAETSDSSSLHLTIGAKRKSGHDVLSWVANHLLDEPLVRKSISLDKSQAILQLNQLSTLLGDTLADPKLLDDFFVSMNSYRRGRTHLSLSDFTTETRSPDRASWFVATHFHVTEDEDELTLSANGKQWCFPGPCILLLQNAIAGKPLKVSDFEELGMEKEQAMSLLSDLRTSGVFSFKEL